MTDDVVFLPSTPHQKHNLCKIRNKMKQTKKVTEFRYFKQYTENNKPRSKKKEENGSGQVIRGGMPCHEIFKHMDIKGNIL